jgi:hypothetical protein
MPGFEAGAGVGVGVGVGGGGSLGRGARVGGFEMISTTPRTP